MQAMKEEILQIPDKAKECYEANKTIRLPRGTPYLGMGASFHAVLTAWYCRADIQPFLASEYSPYFSREPLPLGVFVSQSGETSEVLWNRKHFQEIVAITNHADSPLASSHHIKQVIELYAGQEGFTATKTFMNTLAVLYLGLGMDPRKAIEQLAEIARSFPPIAKEEAERVASYMQGKQIKGLFVLGTGPNIGVALQGALALAESTAFAWQGMSLAQYDHGYKETARDSTVLMLTGAYPNQQRIAQIQKTLENKSNACVFMFQEQKLPELLSPFTHTLRLYLFMEALQKQLGIDASLKIGEKITKAPEPT
ncbi:MAG: hypothetical protein A3C04_03385 [Candidatus Wildermuthbacteria bacterium RIFCSPHIGHO2_02_FULL_45_25]|uniref:Glutamine--fructose-6-phosphate aminotransferase [isomerizing] n=1 Tax=Candidatus Wildermuthbacteria bacterium RIFCSPHIGHO2_02_FULL_45_25 TaxID=1802450 RepID=A0A1G2R1T2_9BACT|nr:MAG: hypothetical protein A3C04_03385 [Candidatus Wildermuthbacteria bacterium RIFCSPHIGHO2_02_FULL_45_25]